MLLLYAILASFHFSVYGKHDDSYYYVGLFNGLKFKHTNMEEISCLPHLCLIKEVFSLISCFLCTPFALHMLCMTYINLVIR